MESGDIPVGAKTKKMVWSEQDLLEVVANTKTSTGMTMIKLLSKKTAKSNQTLKL